MKGIADIADFSKPRDNYAIKLAQEAYRKWKGLPSPMPISMGFSLSALKRKRESNPSTQFTNGIIAGIQFIVTNARVPNYGKEEFPPDFEDVARLASKTTNPNALGQAYGRIIGILQAKLQYILFDEKNQYLTPLTKMIHAFSQANELFKIQLSAVWWKAIETYTQLSKEASQRIQKIEKLLYQPTQIPALYQREVNRL